MKILYITKNEKRVRELKEALKKNKESVVTIDSLFDLEYDVVFTTPSKDLLTNAKKLANAIWKKEKSNYDYVIADGYGLFSEYAPNILGVDSDLWWPGSQRNRCEALVNLFSNEEERNIYYKSVYVAIDKLGNEITTNGVLYGYLAKKVKEKNGDFYDSVFMTKDGKYLSSYTPEEIYKMSARAIALDKLVAKLN